MKKESLFFIGFWMISNCFLWEATAKSAQISTLSVAERQSHGLVLSWPAPVDGKQHYYNLTFSVNQAGSVGPFLYIPFQSVKYTTEGTLSGDVQGLNPGSFYYFKLSQSTDLKKWTQIYSVASATTLSDAPGVKSIDPHQGSANGQYTATLLGSNFAEGAIVKIGENQSTTVHFVNSTCLTVLVPPGAAGPQDVTIINPEGGRVVFAKAFTYWVPNEPQSEPIMIPEPAIADNKNLSQGSGQNSLNSSINSIKTLFYPERGEQARFDYYLGKSGDVNIELYDHLGRKIKSLFNGLGLLNQNNVQIWDGRDDSGVLVPSGYYVAQVKQSGHMIGRIKIVVIR